MNSSQLESRLEYNHNQTLENGDRKMKQNVNKVWMNSQKSTLSRILYGTAIVMAVMAVALLIDNVYIFKTTIDQYVAQGYPIEMLLESLVPSQLLPAVFESIAVYGGIGVILFVLGKINQNQVNIMDLIINDGKEANFAFIDGFAQENKETDESIDEQDADKQNGDEHNTDENIASPDDSVEKE